MAAERFAPAKVNLFLHVGPVASDGYHPLCSLVTFADVGDVVRLEQAPRMEFAVEGPFAESLAGETNNLVTRARDLVLSGRASRPTPFRLTLDKRLPIAAGLGGGSSDAAAAMHLVASWTGQDSDAADRRWLFGLAQGLGADVPMCLIGEPRLAMGRGDELDPPPTFRALEAVLVNPGVASPTGKVYGAYDAAGAPGGADRPQWPRRIDSVAAAADFLAACRNDLEAPAVELQPAIGEALAVLRARPQTLLARMSGSGATCFAICADAQARDDLARTVSAERPDWWVQPCTLAGAR